MADFRLGFRQVVEAATGEYFRFEPTPKQFNMGIIIAVAPAAHALHCLVTGSTGVA